MTPRDILDFWFEETGAKQHFNATPAFDAEIRERFEDAAIGHAVKAAKAPHPCEDTPEGALAHIIILDQFPRNMYRDTAAAFAWDKLSLAAAKRCVAHGFDFKTPMERRSFIYMPFMHSEVLADQKCCVELVDERLDSESTLFHAKAHMKMIERFGRFPHRNKILGRESTQAEIQYLKDGGYVP